MNTKDMDVSLNIFYKKYHEYEDPEVAEDSSITEDYKNAWMDALEDYKPAPEDFQAELEARIAERKNII